MTDRNVVVPRATRPMSASTTVCDWLFADVTVCRCAKQSRARCDRGDNCGKVRQSLRAAGAGDRSAEVRAPAVLHQRAVHECRGTSEQLQQAGNRVRL